MDLILLIVAVERNQYKNIPNLVYHRLLNINFFSKA